MISIGSLFSGIAGLDRGVEAELPDARIVWFAESDLPARRVLATHYPGVKIFPDVKQVDERAPAVDLIVGGFPCQDVSNAGKRGGITGKRSGLWREYARIIRVQQPAIVFIENVASLAVRGLDVVLADLAALGFDAEWDLFQAADVGAPHKRERIFILAYAAGAGRRRQAFAILGGGRSSPLWPREAEPDGRGGDVPDADGSGREGDAGGLSARGRAGAAGCGGGSLADASGDGLRIEPERDQRDRGGVRAAERQHAEPIDDRAALADADGDRRQGERFAQPRRLEGAPGREPDRRGDERYVHHFPPGPARIGEWDGPQPAVRRGDDGFSVGLDRRWRAKNGRPDRLRLLGNAVVPQQAALAWRTLTARVSG